MTEEAKQRDPNFVNTRIEESSNSYIEQFFKDKSLTAIAKYWRFFIAAVAIGYGTLSIYWAGFGTLPSWQHRSIHVGVILILAYAWFPCLPSYKKSGKMHPLLDGVPFGLSVLVTLYMVFQFPEILYRTGSPSQNDIIVGTLLILLIIEAVRRCTGPAMAILTAFMCLYIFIGPWFPGLLGHSGFRYSKMIDTMFISTQGIFSDPIYVSSTVLILFLIFCAFLLKTGVGQFFIDLAFSLTGGKRGGPALAAVSASALMATITGNGAANATMTGSFTIPMMKKIGYKPHFAGAVEAVASQGGQIMPPIMGASAFIMAEYTGIPYIKIAGYALVPAIFYFLTAGIVIYLQARKRNLQGIPKEQLPNFWNILQKQGYMTLPLILIVTLMVKGYSPMMSGFWAIIITYALSLLSRYTRMNWLSILAALEQGVRNTVTVACACAAAGIIVGSVILTGLGIRFSRFAIELSGGELLPLLLLIMLASIILGMGMPTVSAYVILAVLAVPALENQGVLPIAAHLFVFYFGIVSGITPPVAITAYITAGIAGAKPNQTAITACLIGLGGFIVPYMFIYNHTLLLQGEPLTIIHGVTTALLGCIAFAGAIQGYLLDQTNILQRLMLVLSAFALVKYGLVTDIIGIGLLLAVYFTQKISLNKKISLSKSAT
ncbi:TRAP transporter permease [Desulfallas sp. Bu1-1]|uniref:TRAP transporter permease n=1 Tax=Desulfallas sp. Bu1-1 TaxID=2787620 RepID=UPI00189F25E6|nr:TRAP transporter permease [Desulfallas sp. Bu1-1]MBF7083664.1 TRAP transporter permease [Desulfallas sp. Bu1-1]